MRRKSRRSWPRALGEMLLAAALPALGTATLAGEFRRAAPPSSFPPPATGSSLGVGEALDVAAGRGALWVDARPAEAFARGHAPGAVPLTEERWGDQLGGVLERWTPAAPVIVYCDGGDCHASERVAARLRDAGVDPVFTLRGGWAELEKAESGRESATGRAATTRTGVGDRSRSDNAER